MTIIPAILEKEKEVFLQRAGEIEKLLGVSRVQIDFCDGVFVPTTSLSVQEVDVLNPTIHWEAHLMVREPVDFFDYQMVGFSTIIIHLEAFGEKDASLEEKSALARRSLEAIQSFGMHAGLAINPETSVEALVPFAGLVDQFTLLTVHPGRQGEDMLPESLERVKRLKSLLPNAIIEIDGGAHKDNIKLVKDTGVDLVVVGSGLKNVNIEKEFEIFSQEINK